MRKASIWISLVCIVSAIIFLLPSCNSTSTTTATTSKTTSTTSATSQATTAVTTKPSDKPIYGGEFVFHWANDVTGFDPAVTIQMDCRAEYQVTDELIGENWAKGPAGSSETDWTVGFVGRMGLETGSLAESWELPDPTTIIFNIRHGVNWQAKAPVNGREFTAADVVWNINRNMTIKSTYLYGAFLASLRPTAWEATDQYTVKVTVPKEGQGLWLVMLGDFMWMVPHEVIDTYGDMTNWKNVVGTGPFILNDYVSGSSVTYKRNPDYWKEDPVHPGNKLPYVDSLKMLIIVDTSTQQSAMRTGKIDRLDALEHEDAMNMMKSAPDVQYKKYLPSMNPTLIGRMDKQDLPFKDIKVRQAMNMAINKQEIVDTYYSGDAELFAYPYQPTKSYTPFFTPLDQEPQIVQDVFSYDLDKAKALLAEAGYPDGFSTTIDCQSGDQADYLSAIKDYLDDVNIDLQIVPHEAGVMLSIARAKSHKEMIYKLQTTHAPFRLLSARLESVDDAAYFETPYSRETYNWVNANVSNETEVAARLKEYGTWELSQVWGVWLPVPYYHVMWWPWVKGYHGEVTMGWDNQTKYTQYIWVDMTQKEALGH